MLVQDPETAKVDVKPLSILLKEHIGVVRARLENVHHDQGEPRDRYSVGLERVVIEAHQVRAFPEVLTVCRLDANLLFELFYLCHERFVV